MRVAFVSGPYRAATIHEVLANIRTAEAVGVALWRLGYAAIIPHRNTGLLDGIVADDAWLAGDIAILERLRPGRDVLVTVPGWEGSIGARGEVQTAQRSGVTVRHWPQDRELLEREAKED